MQRVFFGRFATATLAAALIAAPIAASAYPGDPTPTPTPTQTTQTPTPTPTPSPTQPTQTPTPTPTQSTQSPSPSGTPTVDVSDPASYQAASPTARAEATQQVVINLISSGAIPGVPTDAALFNTISPSPSSVSDVIAPEFQPGTVIEVRYLGAQTQASVIIGPNPTPEQVIQQLSQPSGGSNPPSSISIIPAPSLGNVPNPQLNNANLELLTAVGLPGITTLNSLPLNQANSWIEMTYQLLGYLPGSFTFSVMTSDPVLINEAEVSKNGEATLTSLVPIDILPVGEHHFRTVGILDLGTATVGPDGKPVFSEEQLAAFETLDGGTVGHLIATGVGPDGKAVTAVVSSGVPESSNMWALWLAIIVGTISAILAYFLRFESKARTLLSTLALLGAAPAIVLGLIDNSVSFSIIGALIGFGFAAVANWTPFKRNPALRYEPAAPAMA